MEFETILTEERDGIFIITFNRLEARNAMNNLMTKEIGDALEYWDHNDDLRVCIITNNGHVFCAGSDLKELAAGAYEVPEGREKWGFAAMTKRSFDKPIIAAVHGKALGGGMEIVAACDLAVAANDSVFGVPDDQVLDKAIYLAQKIILGAPLSIKYTKKTVIETMGENFPYPSKGWETLEEYEKITRASEDAHEGEVAFAEKRKPVWTGR